MTRITIYCRDNTYVGFCMEGHSGYAEAGEDIVCAGLSVLAINFVNSIEQLTSDEYTQFEHEDDGIIDFEFFNKISIFIPIVVFCKILSNIFLALR